MHNSLGLNLLLFITPARFTPVLLLFIQLFIYLFACLSTNKSEGIFFVLLPLEIFSAVVIL